MNHYRGNLRDLRDTMEMAQNSLGHLSNISRQVAIAANGRIHRPGLANLGLSSFASSAISPDTAASSYVNDGDIVKTQVGPQGNVATTYADGSVKIFDKNGNDVTANYIKNPSPPSALQQAALAVDNVTGPLTDTAANALNSLSATAKQVLTVGMVVGVIYMVYKLETAK